MRNDHMVLTLFGQATVSGTQNGAWMHPGSDPRITEPDYYINLARMAERVGFDMMFFDDRFAMPAVYGNSIREAVRRGTRAVKLDLLTLVGLIAAHTDRIGLGATYSTTYYHPFHVARAFATLDHLSKGRAIWNIVTSLNEDEAQNFGRDFLEHDGRYDRADEFLEVVTGLWNTWERDALEIDRTTGVYANPDKVHELNYRGEHYSSRGPLTVPRPPQGWPTLLQAGQSGRGREFAARWADVIFTISGSIGRAKEAYAAQHAAFEAVGRDFTPGKILPLATVVTAPTDELAKAKREHQISMSDPVEALMLLSELSGVDFAAFPLNKPLPEDIVETVTGSKAIIKSVIDPLREQYGPDATARDLGEMSAKGTGYWFIGSPERVADEMCEWFESEACDGFVIGQTDTPGSFEEFGRYIIPELRRRGVVREQDDTDNRPFRERMGFARRDS